MLERKQQIEQEAQILLNSYNCSYDEYSLDVETLAKNLGASITVVPYPTTTMDSISLKVRNQHDFQIFLPFNTSTIRDRFQIAHELGHVMLHYRNGEKTDFFRYDNSYQDKEANMFASALLMPESKMLEAIIFNSLDSKKLGKIFGVPKTVANIRAESVVELTKI